MSILVNMGVDASKIKAIREKLGMTQQEAAQKAGLKNRQYWNNVERGERSNLTIETLEKIAAALGVKAKDLLK